MSPVRVMLIKVMHTPRHSDVPHSDLRITSLLRDDILGAAQLVENRTARNYTCDEVVGVELLTWPSHAPVMRCHSLETDQCSAQTASL